MQKLNGREDIRLDQISYMEMKNADELNEFVRQIVQLDVVQGRHPRNSGVGERREMRFGGVYRRADGRVVNY